MRMKVTGISTSGAAYHITLEPDVDDLGKRDADGVTMVEIHCGVEAAKQFGMGGKHEIYIGGSAYGGGNGKNQS